MQAWPVGTLLDTNRDHVTGGKQLISLFLACDVPVTVARPCGHVRLYGRPLHALNPIADTNRQYPPPHTHSRAPSPTTPNFFSKSLIKLSRFSEAAQITRTAVPVMNNCLCLHITKYFYNDYIIFTILLHAWEY